MILKRINKSILLLIAVLLCASSTAFGQSSELSFSKASSGSDIVLSVNESAGSLYLVFTTEPGDYTVNGKAVENSYFLQQYIQLEPCTSITISGASPSEIHVFDGTDVPDWVHIWQEPCEKADILLFSSHADDEQLFFAGLLPYYTQVRKLEVQVAYATDHLSQLSRHQERLNGLYDVGVRHYPVSSGYNDLYSETYEQALANLVPYGIDEAAIIAWEKDVINRFQPQLIVTHDVNGEYGHGMHKLVNGTLQEALANAETEFPFLMKVYFHLYDKNQISFDLIDQSFDQLGGLTPFQLTQQKGFAAHESQHWTWFKRWIYGSSGNITKASEIQTYSPLLYGCWYSCVDPDVNKNDLFENLTSYEEQRLAYEAELAEQQRQAELARQQELERIAQQQAEEARRQRLIRIGLAALAIVVMVIVLIIVWRKKASDDRTGHSRRYHGRH